MVSLAIVKSELIFFARAKMLCLNNIPGQILPISAIFSNCNILPPHSVVTRNIKVIFLFLGTFQKIMFPLAMLLLTRERHQVQSKWEVVNKNSSRLYSPPQQVTACTSYSSPLSYKFQVISRSETLELSFSIGTCNVKCLFVKNLWILPEITYRWPLLISAHRTWNLIRPSVFSLSHCFSSFWAEQVWNREKITRESALILKIWYKILSYF